jgi:hypothetical protein
MVPSQSVRLTSEKNRVRTILTWYWGELIVVALAVALWLPRLSGPIDLRWDAGVYYVLGTSLATGHGYRVLSEPGAPEALQYPPLLPAIVAVYEKALGSTDAAVVGPWLRISYAILFLIYGLAALTLAKRYLPPVFAFAATALCLLHFQTIFLSDLLFTELPFAFVSVIFALVTVNGSSASRLRGIASYALAAAGFLLRTAGVVLLAAWVLEALCRRRWRLAIWRSALALLPIIAWQAHVMRVRASDEYAHPAYQYQRASYQYYNVSYAENAALIDPFHPELGKMSPAAFAQRLATNLPKVALAFGQAVSTRDLEWRQIVQHLQRRTLGRPILPAAVAMVPVLGLAALVLGGLLLLIRKHAWIMVFIILGSVGLVLTTPWPAQFNRYLTPLEAFLSICVFMALSQIAASLQRGDAWANNLARGGLIGIVSLMFGTATYTSLRQFYYRAKPDGIVIGENTASYHLFAHDSSWQDWEKAAAWIDTQTPRNSIVATSAPHFLYLHTGRLAVLPPMESDPVRARHLLESVPVSYVIVDNWKFLDLSRRYARPAMESNSADWVVAQSIKGTQIYRRPHAPGVTDLH